MFVRQIASSLVIAFVVSACSGGASQSSLNAGHGNDIGRFLSPANVPGSVKDAVAEVTKLGRDEGDFFGFELVETYELVESSAQPKLKKIVADVIEASRKHGDYSIAGFCADAGYDDDNECALHLIGHYKQAAHADLFQDLREWYSLESAEGQRMNKAMDHIQSYIGTMVGGADMEEISLNLTGLNVDQITTVLINKAKGHVVILKYNYGA
jgi:hypothetical protein